MTTYAVRFHVGSDRRTIRTAVTLADSETLASLPQKLAARGLTSPWQFPASAVRILSAKPLAA